MSPHALTLPSQEPSLEIDQSLRSFDNLLVRLDLPLPALTRSSRARNPPSLPQSGSAPHSSHSPNQEPFSQASHSAHQPATLDPYQLRCLLLLPSPTPCHLLYPSPFCISPLFLQTPNVLPPPKATGTRSVMAPSQRVESASVVPPSRDFPNGAKRTTLGYLTPCLADESDSSQSSKRFGRVRGCEGW